MRTGTSKGQQWSLEAILAVSVFIVFLVFAIFFIRSAPEYKTRPLELQTISLQEEVRSERGFIRNNVIQEKQLEEWFNLSKNATQLNAFKNQLGIKDKFCIFIMETDENVLRHELPENENYSFIGIGDSDILVANISCGTIINAS